MNPYVKHTSSSTQRRIDRAISRVREVVKRQQAQLKPQEDSDASSSERCHIDLPLKLYYETKPLRVDWKLENKSNRAQWTEPANYISKADKATEIDSSFLKKNQDSNDVSLVGPRSRKVKKVSAFEDRRLVIDVDYQDDLPQWTTPVIIPSIPYDRIEKLFPLRKAKSEHSIPETTRNVREQRQYVNLQNGRSMTNLPRTNLVDKITQATIDRQRAVEEERERYQVKNCRMSKKMYDAGEIRHFMKKQQELRKVRKDVEQPKKIKSKSYDVDVVRKYMAQKKSLVSTQTSPSKSVPCSNISTQTTPKKKDQAVSPQKSPRTSNHSREEIQQFMAEKRKERSKTNKERTVTKQLFSSQPLTSSPQKKAQDRKRLRNYARELTDDQLKRYIGDVLNGSLDENNKVLIPPGLEMTQPSIRNQVDSISPIKEPTLEASAYPAIERCNSVDSVFSALTEPLKPEDGFDSVFSVLSSPLKVGEDYGEISAESSIRVDKESTDKFNRTFDMVTPVLSSKVIGSEKKLEKVARVDPVTRTSPKRSFNHDVTINSVTSLESEARVDPLRLKLDKFTEKFDWLNPEDIYQKVIADVSWDELFSKVFNDNLKSISRKAPESISQPDSSSNMPPLSEAKSTQSCKMPKQDNFAMEVYPKNIPAKRSPLKSPRNSPKKDADSFRRFLDLDRSLNSEELPDVANLNSLSSPSLSRTSSSPICSTNVSRNSSQSPGSPSFRTAMSSTKDRIKNTSLNISVSPNQLNSSLETIKGSAPSKHSNLKLNTVNDELDDDATDNVSSIVSEVSPIKFSEKGDDVNDEPVSLHVETSVKQIAAPEPSSESSSTLKVDDNWPDSQVVESIVRIVCKQIFRAKMLRSEWKPVESKHVNENLDDISTYKLFISDLIKEIIPDFFRDKTDVAPKEDLAELAKFYRKMLFPDSSEKLCKVLCPKVLEMLDLNEVQEIPDLRTHGIVGYWRRTLPMEIGDDIIREDIYGNKEFIDFHTHEDLVLERIAIKTFEDLLEREAEETCRNLMSVTKV
ncbi:hypothetical protein HDE_08552 [Halotydeus destructor]|nr:hypothetical protein HDE_08552 [Halotydeus destructor]